MVTAGCQPCRVAIVGSRGYPDMAAVIEYVAALPPGKITIDMARRAGKPCEVVTPSTTEDRR